MLIIPAIDIKNGACVRLLQGDPKNQTTYSQDPIEVARQWAKKGAKRIHVVDLDGAFSGESKYLELASQMKEETGCEIEFGGGLRNSEGVQKALNLGLDKLILGTSALENSDWIKPFLKTFSGRFMAGLDAKNGMVSTKGWVETSQFSITEALKRMEELGFLETIFTDISRDGALRGPNLDAVRGVMSQTKMGVYASGGVTELDDIKNLSRLQGLRGIIVGKALYDGRIALEDCLAIR